MKAKEKGIDTRTLRRSATPSTDRSTPAPGDKKPFAQAAGIRFNAFREMDKIRKGIPPALALIPDSVAVIGKPLHTFVDKSRKRGREESADERPAKAMKTEVCGLLVSASGPALTGQFFVLEYRGAKLDCDRLTGQVVDKSKVPYVKDAVIKFVGAGPNADWKDLKVRSQSFE